LEKHATDNPFRGIGLSTFLLHMVQLQAVSMEYSTDMYLQSNISSLAFQWYKHHGFELAPTNNLAKLPATLKLWYGNCQKKSHTTPFVHFVPTEVWNNDIKKMDKDPLSAEWQAQRLLLCKLTGLVHQGSCIDVDIPTVESEEMKVFFSVLPTKDYATFLTFPFKESGERINDATNKLNILNHPFFKFRNEGEELRSMEFADMESNVSHTKVPFTSVKIQYIDYQALKEDIVKKNYDLWLKDDMINFFSRWLMRNTSSQYVMATEIIDTVVSAYVTVYLNYFYKSQPNTYFPMMAMDAIHLYLDSRRNLLTKKFIFFPQNEDNKHWWGWVAVNPWSHILNILESQELRKDPKKKTSSEDDVKYISGMLPCDGMDGKSKRSLKDSFHLIWLLNMASAYRDMMVEDVYKNFDIANHTPESYFLIGCCGPFGILDKDLLGKITYPLLHLDNKIKPKQIDGSNCGVIWCLFIFDIMQQALFPYDFEFDKKKKGLLPIDIGIGKTWIHPNQWVATIKNQKSASKEKAEKSQKEYQESLYKAFREEMVILLERLRYLRVENQAGNDEIQAPMNWGEIPSHYNELVRHMGKVFSTNPFFAADRSDLIEEFKERVESLTSIGPVVPGGIFLKPSTDLLDNQKLHDWFLPLDQQYIMKNRGGSYQDLTPLELPFDKAKFELVCQQITASEIFARANLLGSVDSENIAGQSTSTGIDPRDSVHNNESKTDDCMASQPSSNIEKDSEILDEVQKQDAGATQKGLEKDDLEIEDSNVLPKSPKQAHDVMKDKDEIVLDAGVAKKDIDTDKPETVDKDVPSTSTGDMKDKNEEILEENIDPAIQASANNDQSSKNDDEVDKQDDKSKEQGLEDNKKLSPKEKRTWMSGRKSGASTYPPATDSDTDENKSKSNVEEDNNPLSSSPQKGKSQGTRSKRKVPPRTAEESPKLFTPAKRKKQSSPKFNKNDNTEEQKSDENRKMSPTEKKNWLIGRKSIGDVPPEEQISEVDDEKTLTDEDEDNQPLSSVLKPPPFASLADSSQTNLKSWRKLPPTAKGYTRKLQAEKQQKKPKQNTPPGKRKKLVKSQHGPRKKKEKKSNDSLMARKLASHQERWANADDNAPNEETQNDKYDYLIKKDWDDLVIIEEQTWKATDLRNQEAYKLSDLFNLDNEIPFDPSILEVSQTNVREATGDIKELLNVPTQGDFVEQQALLKGENLEKWNKFYKEVNEILETEVTLHQVTHVTELGWEPANEIRSTQLSRDKKLRGRYCLNATQADGTVLKGIPAQTDWVEAHFNKKVLAAAQKAWFSAMKKNEIVSLDGERKRMKLSGFVNVEWVGIPVQIEKDTINQLRYIPPKKLLVGDVFKKVDVNTTPGVKVWEFATDKDGRRIKVDRTEKEEKVIPEKWQGYCNETKNAYTLTTEFVERNFTAGFMEQAKIMRSQGKKMFLKVPPGSAKQHHSISSISDKAPDMKFVQAEGERACMLYSFASVLHHIGAREVASHVRQLTSRISDQHDTFDKFIDFMRGMKRSIQFKKLDLNQWNILNNADNDVVVVLLRGSDLSEDHCVTLFGKWIFDSNLPKALSLSKENLDICCSSDGDPVLFQKVMKALVCMNYMQLLDKKARKKMCFMHVHK